MKLVTRAPQLLALGVVALVPFLALAWKLGVPTDLASAKGSVRTIWLLTPLVWFAQLALAGAAAAALDGRSTARGFARAVVPCGLAIVAIACGLVALAVPGFILIVLFALTGAVATDDAGSAFADSTARVRGQLARVAIVVGVALVVDAAIIYVAQRLVLAIPAKPTADQLATFVMFRRIVALALVVVTPVVAGALATVARAARR